MIKSIVEKLVLAAVFGLVALLPAAYGTWQASSHHLGESSGNPTVPSISGRLEALEAERIALNTEMKGMKELLLTTTGNCTHYRTEAKMAALVNRRSPYKRGQKLIVTNLSSEGMESSVVTVVGDFESREGVLLIKVSPDCASLLLIPPDSTVRVECKPVD